MHADQHEVILKGGRANTGNVVRIGDQVARPTYPQTEAVEHFLTFLAGVGIDFVPKPLGYDDQGRHRLSFLPGTAPTPPYPDWAFNETLLVQVAGAQRKLHQAAAGYEPPPEPAWAESAGDYFPPGALRSGEGGGESGTGDGKLLVCHNDVGMTNVIVDDDHQFVGMIDFDYCRPVDPLFDIAVAVRHWAPFGNLDLRHDRELDRVRRFGLFCDVHELGHDQRRRVTTLAVSFLEHARENIKALAASGREGFQTLLDNGYEATNESTVAWLTQHAETLATS